MSTEKHKNKGSATPPNGHLYTKGAQQINNHMLPDICHLNRGIPQQAIASDVNLRSGFNRWDRDRERPSDAIPTDHPDIIVACQSIYRKIGMIRNIIDLMTDFAAEGLDLQHTVKSQERFYRKWAKKVDLEGRAHDFMKLLMRDANIIVRRTNAQITKPVARQMAKGGIPINDTIDETRTAEPPEKVKTDKKSTKKGEIPWKYTFLSPALIEKVSGEIGKFFGDDTVGMRIPPLLAAAIQNPETKSAQQYIDKLPREVVQAAKVGKRLVKLDMDRIYVDYYKKDDWEDWGTPFLYGVLEDVMFKDKMRLADMAALDGVINVIRVWKLGKSADQIMPTPAAVDKLIDILQHNNGGGVLDLVWDDMIDLSVEYPPTDKILGQEKYSSVNADIVRGLGIPDSLVGGQDLGTRNAQSAFVQLKTLVERLEYVRSRAIRWMEGELRRVADAMGFKKIPAISFGIMSLRDEAAEKQLMIQLLDRGIISAEKATEVFGVNYMIELERLKSEQQIREDNPPILEKAGPYYRPESVTEQQTQSAIQIEKVKQGFNRDSSFPNKTDDNGGGDNISGDQPKDEGNNPAGRPSSTKDTSPRDARTPKSLSALNVIGEGLLGQVDDLFDNIYLERNKVKNMRSLTKAQRAELERVKRGILYVLRPGDTVTTELVAERLNSIGAISHKMENIFNELVADMTSSTNKEPTPKERRMLTYQAWATAI
jgi:hypothetical protein